MPFTAEWFPVILNSIGNNKISTFSIDHVQIATVDQQGRPLCTTLVSTGFLPVTQQEFLQESSTSSESSPTSKSKPLNGRRLVFSKLATMLCMVVDEKSDIINNLKAGSKYAQVCWLMNNEQFRLGGSLYCLSKDEMDTVLPPWSPYDMEWDAIMQKLCSQYNEMTSNTPETMKMYRTNSSDTLFNESHIIGFTAKPAFLLLDVESVEHLNIKDSISRDLYSVDVPARTHGRISGLYWLKTSLATTEQ